MDCRSSVLVLLLAASLIGCGKVEEAEIEGTWVGQTAGLEKRPGSFKETWRFQDGEIYVEDRLLYTYQIDATSNPKQIDITTHFAGMENELRRGIYKIENDILTYCYIVPRRAKSDAKRPTEFYSKERDDVIDITYRRQK